MPTRKRKLLKRNLPSLTAKKSSLKSLSEQDVSLLKQVQFSLKHMGKPKFEEIRNLFESQEKQGVLNISFDSQDVSKEDLPMKTLMGDLVIVPSIEVPNLTRDVVRIQNVIVEQERDMRTPKFSEYFYKSSGTSRAMGGLKDTWLPCGDIPLKEDLPNIRYSKLEDEILTKVNQILENAERLDGEQYQTTFAKFKDEFPTWYDLMHSIITYGRFLTATNAMISYKLHQMHLPQNNVSEVVAEGIKGNKKNKSIKKKRKHRKQNKPKTKGKPKDKVKPKTKGKPKLQKKNKVPKSK